MDKRLQTVLEIEHVSAAQLADTLGIQRGGVSHLLSGRNKPSYDFLQKILTKYPDINAEWLITGQGRPIKMPVTESDTINKDTQNSIIQNSTTLFPSVDQPRDDSQSSPLSTTPREESGHPDGSEMTHPDNDPISIVRSPSRSVKRIIIYYSDGTFTDFYPGKE